MNYQRDEQIALMLAESGFEEIDSPSSQFVEFFRRIPSGEVRIVFTGTPPQPELPDDEKENPEMYCHIIP
jgi:hypothetical protein